MDGLNSFFTLNDGLDILYKESNVAIIEVKDAIQFANKHPCMLQSVWRSTSPIYTASMFMKKNSSLTPFISHEIRKSIQRGLTNLLQERYKKLDPTCKPTISVGKSMSLERIASFFVIFLTLAFVSFLIYIFESQLCRKVIPTTKAVVMEVATDTVAPYNFQRDQTTPVDL